MKYLPEETLVVLAFLLVCLTSSSITNTSDFYMSEIGYRLYYESYSGYEDAFSNGSASIYYSLWQAFMLSWDDKSIPLIIWFQGGPGTPGQFGCFNEIGPIFLEGQKGNIEPTQNPWGWSFDEHVMCVDHIVGVGFSYSNGTSTVTNSSTAATHFITFLSNFFKNNPKLGLAQNPLYLAGEGFAGHFIPVVAEKMATSSSFNLKGVIIGAGWLDPINQVNNYNNYLNSEGAVANQWRDTTSVANQWRDTTSFMQNEAIVRLMRGDSAEDSGYIKFPVNQEVKKDQEVAKNRYLRMKIKSYKEDINPDYKYYLQEKKKEFGVPDWVNYVDENPKVMQDFAGDLSTSVKRQLETLLNLNISTLIYNGQNDVVVTTAEVLSYINSLEWQYAKQWKAQPKKIWSQSGSQSFGWYKYHRNLIFLQVRNAGHIVTVDQPRSAWLMLRKYFRNLW